MYHYKGLTKSKNTIAQIKNDLTKIGYIVDLMWMGPYKSIYKTHNYTKIKDRLGGLLTEL